MKRSTKTFIAQCVANAGVGFVIGRTAAVVLMPFCRNKVEETLAYVGLMTTALMVTDKVNEVVANQAEVVYALSDYLTDED